MSSRAPKARITQILRKSGRQKLLKDCYCRYLIGDFHILFFLFVFRLLKRCGFVLMKILITQTLRRPKKSHKQKQVLYMCFCFSIRTMYHSILCRLWITEDLFVLNNWYTSNGLAINFDKTVYMLFSKQTITETLQPIVFNNILIRRVVTYKYLGLLLDNKLKWNEHLTHIRARLLLGVRAILKLRRLVNTQHLLSIYYSLIHTHFTYMAGIWGSASKTKISSKLSKPEPSNLF